MWRAWEKMRRVLPAYAGMIPVAQLRAETDRSAPRVCGDDPSIGDLQETVNKCSPRMRG